MASTSIIRFIKKVPWTYPLFTNKHKDWKARMAAHSSIAKTLPGLHPRNLGLSCAQPGHVGGQTNPHWPRIPTARAVWQLDAPRLVSGAEHGQQSATSFELLDGREPGDEGFGVAGHQAGRLKAFLQVFGVIWRCFNHSDGCPMFFMILWI